MDLSSRAKLGGRILPEKFGAPSLQSRRPRMGRLAANKAPGRSGAGWGRRATEVGVIVPRIPRKVRSVKARREPGRALSEETGGVVEWEAN